MAKYPFILKIFIAPLIDTHYSRILGKSKTYILICGITLSIAILLFAENIETYIDQKQVYSIFFFLLIIATLLSFQDVACDAWMLTILGSEKKVYGSYARWLGDGAGYVIGYNFFTLLNSDDFCKKIH